MTTALELKSRGKELLKKWEENKESMDKKCNDALETLNDWADKPANCSREKTV